MKDSVTELGKNVSPSPPSELKNTVDVLPTNVMDSSADSKTRICSSVVYVPLLFMSTRMSYPMSLHSSVVSFTRAVVFAFIASVLAVAKDSERSLTAVVRRLLFITPMKGGTAKMRITAAMVRVTISSISVKPLSYFLNLYGFKDAVECCFTALSSLIVQKLGFMDDLSIIG